MPPTEFKPSRAMRPFGILLGIIALGLICFVGLKIGGYLRGSHPEQTANTGATPLAPGTNIGAPSPAPPGAPISAQEVVDKLDAWLAKHPNYHAKLETAFLSGTVMDRMDVFAYTNAANGQVAEMKTQVLLPQPIQYQAQKINGRLEVYFPRSDQLIEVDTNKMPVAIPGLTANQSGMKGMLKIARSSFAESSEDLRVVTMVFDAEKLNVTGVTGDVYVSLRTDDEGKLLGVVEQSRDLHLNTKVTYLTFDRDLVIRDAPKMPAGKIAVSNITLQAAMKEEALELLGKPLGNKI